jgi:hypothetical protein
MQADPKEAKMGKNDPNCTVLAEDEQIFVDEYNKWSQSTKNKKIPKSLNMEAEDVSQEAFIRAWKVFKKAEKPIQNIPAYLSTIRKNFLKSLKKQTRKENPVSKEKQTISPTSLQSPILLIPIQIFIRKSLFKIMDQIWIYFFLELPFKNLIPF